MSIEGDYLATRFTWIDYLVLGVLLSASAAIGVFYGCFRKQKDTTDFLMAGKSMGTFPVALSLLTSFLSSVSLLGIPTEAYVYGTSYFMTNYCFLLVFPVTAYLYMPVFWSLQMNIFMAIVVYAPSLALVQVTGVNLYLSVSVTCFVCIFYTTLGGLKAVLWTDVLQAFVLYGSFLFVIIQGTIEVGGFSYVWQKNEETERLEWLVWNFDPTIRHSFLSIVFGNYVNWLFIYGVNQAQIQRYLCVKKQTMAVKALWINLFGVMILTTMCIYNGMIAYAKYWDCDPLESGKITKSDQILPFFVMDVLGNWRGLPGIFVAGIFSGTLSTVSSGINAMAAMFMEDFVALCSPNLSKKKSMHLSKVLSFAFGIICFGTVFIVERLGNVLSVSVSLFSMLGAPLLGVFTLGMFFPMANKFGAIIGLLASLIITLWMGMVNQLARLNGEIPSPLKVTSVEACLLKNNTSYSSEDTTTFSPGFVTNGTDSEELLYIYRFSYFLYSPIGFLLVLLIGLLVSLITGCQDIKRLNPKTLSPVVLWCMKTIGGYSDIGKDIEHREDNSLQEYAAVNRSFSNKEEITS